MADENGGNNDNGMEYTNSSSSRSYQSIKREIKAELSEEQMMAAAMHGPNKMDMEDEVSKAEMDVEDRGGRGDRDSKRDKDRKKKSKRSSRDRSRSPREKRKRS
jgi:hypothetical protein